ncbi:MAG: outer membrane protein [Beijerinckiaceae bacterium]
MKRFLLMSTVATGAMLGGVLAPAMAADLPRKTVAPVFAQPAPIFNWSGFYVGLNGGYVFDTGKSQLTGTAALLGTGLVPAGKTKTMGDGFTIGGTLGYNYQIGNFVAGIETDLAYMDLGKRVSTTFGPLTTTQSQEMSYFGTLRGRLGYAFDNVLIYATGGLAYGDQKARTTITGLASQWDGSKSDTRFGYTLGAGMEYAFNRNWSAKIEYLYYDLGKTNYTSPLVAGAGAGAAVFATSKAENRGNIVRAGINYRF